MFFLLIVCVIYFQSPLSHVNKITVKGNGYLTQNEIIIKSELSSEENIWGIDEEKIAQKIDELEQIKSSTVHIEWPNNILIEVNEWRRVAYYKKDLDFFPILENGDMLNQKEENIPVHAPLLFEFSDGDTLERMVQELIKLPEEIVRSISEIYLTPTSNDPLAVTVYMNDGFEVKATIRTFSTKMSHYPSIVSQLDPNIKGVIDLTVGAYFNPYESQVEEEQEINLEDNSSNTTNEN